MPKKARQQKGLKSLMDKDLSTKDLLMSNIPNFLTVSRIILTFVVVYLIITKKELGQILFVFIVAALTDFLDGKLARKYHWESEFGRRADMIADRFLWMGTALAFLVSYGITETITWKEAIPLLLMMTREIICAPFALIAFFSGNLTPQARYIAKVTTFIQGFALPVLILGVYYPTFLIPAWILSIAAAISGFFSALYYMHDINVKDKKKK